MAEISLYSFDSFMKHNNSLVLGRKFHFGKNLAYERILARFQHKFNWTNSIYEETTVSLTMFKHLLQYLFIFLSLKSTYIHRITLFFLQLTKYFWSGKIPETRNHTFVHSIFQVIPGNLQKYVSTNHSPFQCKTLPAHFSNNMMVYCLLNVI